MTQNKLGLYSLDQMRTVVEQALRIVNKRIYLTKDYLLRYMVTSYNDQAFQVLVLYVPSQPEEQPIYELSTVTLSKYHLTIDNTDLSADNYINKLSKCGIGASSLFDKHNTSPTDDVYCKMALVPEDLANNILIPMMNGFDKSRQNHPYNTQTLG